MSDSFSDLWNSSAPVNKPATLGSSQRTQPATGQQGQQRKGNQPDLFSLLAPSSSYQSGTQGNGRYGSNVGSRSITPSTIGAVGSASNTTPRPGSGQSTHASTSGGDAFRDLLSGLPGNASKVGSTAASAQMTLAARQAKEAERRSSPAQTQWQQQQQKKSVDPTHDAWSGLDSLGSVGLGAGTPAMKQQVQEDDWGLGDFGPTATMTKTTTTTASRNTGSTATSRTNAASPLSKPAVSQTKNVGALWDLDDFANPSASTSSSNGRPSDAAVDDDWGLSDFGSQSQTKKAPQRPTQDFDSPDRDFNFGAREDFEEPVPRRPRGKGLLDLEDDEDLGGHSSSRRQGLLDSEDEHGGGDDVLGDLSRPVEEVRKRTEPATTSRRPPARSNTASPPPHIIGQIVEMGFSVSQARRALASTSTGMDVQAALDLLLNSGQEGSGSSVPPPMPPRPTPEAASAPARPRGAPKGQKERERERQERQRQQQQQREAETVPSSTPAVSLGDIQEQADKLISQASEVGISVLNKASAFWKGTVVKAYEERTSGIGAAGSGAAGAGPVVGGKPKWMQDAQISDDEVPSPIVARGGFSDEVSPVTERSMKTLQQDSVPEPYQEVEVDLFSSESTPPVPRRPQQHQQQQQQQQPQKQQQQQHRAQQHPRRRSPQRTVSGPPRRKRTLQTISPPSLATATKHKIAGTEHFKLGQYGSAVDAYTLAIEAVPEGHLLRVPLFTNRALARIKTGEYKGAEEDAEGALRIVCSVESSGSGVSEFESSGGGGGWQFVWSPAMEDLVVVEAGATKASDGGWSSGQGLGVDLVDGYIKAVKRRSEALEGREKWAEACRGWEVLASGGWVTDAVKKEAARGAARCRTLVQKTSDSASLHGDGPAPTTSIPKPKPKPQPRPVVVQTGPSKAVEALHESNAQAEAEDALRHQLKDSVDGKLLAWKGGKETNIRALLSSLDSVLWEEILTGGVKVSIAALVTPIQVKKAYMRIIGRVHPDKLNAQNSTVEQRMLANGVFGTLNEAWIAFQAS